METRVTQKQVAARAGVHSTTVSMVFRNHPSIPAKTNKRIRAIASKMGYKQDPMLSALAAYRTQCRPVTFHGTMVWMTNSNEGFDWKLSPHFSKIFEGISVRAEQHGYKIEVVDVHKYRSNPNRLASIMRSRNNQGILLCPQPSAHTVLDFPWENFAIVSFGYTLEAPKVNLVAFAYFRTIRRILDHAQSLGYERIGLVLDSSDDERYDHNVLAGYLVNQFQSFGKIPISPLIAHYRSQPELLEKWMKKQRPDAIVCHDWRVHAILKNLGYQTPGDLGLACAGFPEGIENLSGIRENSREIAATGVDLLAAMIQRGERGVPEKPRQILVGGDWVDGGTF